MWIKMVNEGIAFLLLLSFAIVFYRGFKKNLSLLSEREELLKRYLLFRGDKQVRLKVFGEDEKVYQELLKNISNSWKNFKKSYDQWFLSLVQHTARTKRFLLIITLGLLANSIRLLAEGYYFFGFRDYFFHILVREFSNYVLVAFGFFLLSAQTQRFLSIKGEAIQMDREILFFPNHLSGEGEHEGLYNEFDPLETLGADDGKKDQHPGE